MRSRYCGDQYIQVDKMMKTEVTVSSGGIGFVGLLTIVFVVLKLLGYIDWSWWWVLSPIWITFILVMFLVGVIVLIWALYEFSR